jgi:hypothetical protein
LPVVTGDQHQLETAGDGMMGQPLIGRIEDTRLGHEPAAALAVEFVEPVAGFDQDELTPVIGLELTETPLQETAQFKRQGVQLLGSTQDAHRDLLSVEEKKAPRTTRAGGAGKGADWITDVWQM